MTLTVVLSFVVTMILSAAMIPLIIKVGNQLGIVAHMNKRTVHKHEIARIGGYAIYISSLIGSMLFLKTDHQINAILISGFIIFMVGLYDDVHDLSPKVKLIFEMLAALIVIVYGQVYIKGFGYFPSDAMTLLSGIVTLFWIIGITNAINLIDGLDGLSAGISIIVLVTISVTSILSGRSDIAALSLVLAGSIMGFLFFNFHPAKIFMGDCGALYIGFMISVISLLGFGYNASGFFTLGAPIIVLMVPIMDTLIAILRRKIHHKKFSEADRGHLHHNLMFKLNLSQRKSVLILYLVTILFSLSSYLYYYNQMAGTILFIALMILFEIFVEITDMISRKYKPLLTLANIFIDSDKFPKIKFLDQYRKRRTQKKAMRDHFIIGVLCLSLVVVAGYFISVNNPQLPIKTTAVKSPYSKISDIDLMNTIYARLDTSYKEHNEEDECQLVAAYFACDYYTFVDKKDDEIGGLDYMYPDMIENFSNYANTSFYSQKNNYPELEVLKYNIISFSPSKVSISNLDDNNYYNVLIFLTFNEEVEGLNTTVNVTVVKVDDRFYICGLDNA